MSSVVGKPVLGRVVNKKPSPNALANSANPIDVCKCGDRSGVNAVPASQVIVAAV